MTNSNSVANYYSEVSYGQEQLNVTVTPNWAAIGQSLRRSNLRLLRRSAAKADASSTRRHSPPTSIVYNNRYYVFPNLSACGWAGLAYVGFGRSLQQRLQHTRGVRARARPQFRSAACGQPDVAPVRCRLQQRRRRRIRRSVRHHGQHQHRCISMPSRSRLLQWIPATSVKTHTTGNRHLHLGADRIAGRHELCDQDPGSGQPNLLGRVPSADRLRQPGLARRAPNNGAQIRVSSPFESTFGLRRHRIARHDAGYDLVRRRGAACRAKLHRHHLRHHDHRRVGVADFARCHRCASERAARRRRRWRARRTRRRWVRASRSPQASPALRRPAR